MTSKPTVRTPPATQGAARAVAAPAAPALGVCTLKGQSGAGMLDLFSSSVLQRPVTAAQVRSNSDLAATARAASKRAAFKAWAQA